MKTIKTTPCLLLAALLAAGTGSVGAANSPTNTAPAANRSAFTIPVAVKDGRDPFYPTTTRAFEPVAAANQNTNQPAGQSVEIAALKCPGVSGTPGHLLAIINNHTFAIGDEGDVLTPNGKIHLRCLEIHPDAVIVEIGGKIHRINLETQ